MCVCLQENIVLYELSLSTITYPQYSFNPYLKNCLQAFDALWLTT